MTCCYNRLKQFEETFLALLDAFRGPLPNLSQAYEGLPSYAKTLCLSRVAEECDAESLAKLKLDDMTGLEALIAGEPAIAGHVLEGKKFCDVMAELGDDEYEMVRMLGMRLCLLAM